MPNNALVDEGYFIDNCISISLSAFLYFLIIFPITCNELSFVVSGIPFSILRQSNTCSISMFSFVMMFLCNTNCIVYMLLFIGGLKVFLPICIVLLNWVVNRNLLKMLWPVKYPICSPLCSNKSFTISLKSGPNLPYSDLVGL